MKPAGRASLGWLVPKSAFILPMLRRPAHQRLQRADRYGLHRHRLAHGVALLVKSLGF